ncbi:helix-turn-helix domain-containing protein [Flavivirga amylovorans]|uniref:Helix-turn-helix domain-containing protein n=1 Tax=Flavivirga amylovorans TaxID=870486 RepID=A0ABT8WX47_9FLAO|nr:helix-turn-helix domain-containing protein [Flavivirga amylovorans]MDO5986254.1 helix-turn-helix domain-containing protein [Flavivirga amylovorans]
MKKNNKRSECPISRALDILGDKWTLLIIRDIVFRGLRFYNEFLESGEGIATNILSDRLKMLESNDFLISKKYELQKTKKVYTLTEKGIGLIPIVLEMLVFGFNFDNTLQVSNQDSDKMNAVIHRIMTDKDTFLKEIITSVRNFDAKNYC